MSAVDSAPGPPAPGAVGSAPDDAVRAPRLRPYAALTRISVRSLLVHRLNFVLGPFAMLFQLVAMLSIWAVLLRSGAAIAGFDWPEMKAYLLVAYATGAVLFFTDYRLAWRIRDGIVAVDLTKPVDFQRARFAEAAGAGTVEIGFAAVVCGLVIAVSGGVPVPEAGRPRCSWRASRWCCR